MATYEKNEEGNHRGIETVREAQGDFAKASGAPVSLGSESAGDSNPAGSADGGDGKGKGKGKKGQPKPPKTPKVKTDEQIARAVSYLNLFLCSRSSYRI